MSLEARVRTLASTIGARVKAVEQSLAGKANVSHSHVITDLPVAASGTSSTTLLVRADDSRLRAVGTTAGTVAAGDDPRFTDARTPTAHTHDDRYYTETESDGRYVLLTDARLTDARTPTTHTHVAANITDPNNLPGAEVAYSERTSNFTSTNTTAGSAATTSIIQSLSVAASGVGRDVDIEFIAVVQHSVASANVGAYLMCNGSYTTGPGAGYLSGVSLGATGSGRTLYFKRRVAIPAGTTHTYTVGVYTTIAGTITILGSSALPIVLMATRV